mmetsp:Transcript_10773/g.25752  ORF Transcript_10773/g.25752 Transcript_10773/m.25752 type:complete len:280 (-) Transcript_10773:148-987(-)
MRDIDHPLVVVRGHQHSRAPAAELVHLLSEILLLNAGVQGGDQDPGGGQLASHVLGLSRGVAEDHPLRRSQRLPQLQQHLRLELLLLAVHVELPNPVQGDCRNMVHRTNRAVHDSLHEFGRRGAGRRSGCDNDLDGLVQLLHHVPDLLQEPPPHQIRHLVQHQRPHSLHLQHPAPHQVQHPPGRADHHLPLGLPPERRAAHRHAEAEAAARGRGPEGPEDVVRPLPVGAEDQRLGLGPLRVHARQQGQGATGGLPCAGLGDAEHILPLHHGRHGLALDR